MALPTTARTYRRWAIRRLAWDRVERGSLLFAYVKTVVSVVLCPWCAARRIAVPDRWGRAVRWAAAHAVILGLAATLLCNDRTFSRWVVHQFRPDPLYHPMYFWQTDAPAGRIAVWAAESLVAWTFAFAAPPATAALLALALPRRHRAWKTTVAKWALYCTPTLGFALLWWYGFCWPIGPGYYMRGGGITVLASGPVPDLPLRLLGAVYALWWIAGVLGNVYRSRFAEVLADRICAKVEIPEIGRWRYKRNRIVARFLVRMPLLAVYAGLFVGVWWLLIKIVFPPGALGGLM